MNRYFNLIGVSLTKPTADGKESGLTTITAFDEGAYDGGYFIIPRYRCGFRLGDGDVFVTNSQAFHSVSPLVGDGERLSVVSYTKTTLGYKEYAERAYPALRKLPHFIPSERCLLFGTQLETLKLAGGECCSIVGYKNQRVCPR